MFSASTVTRRNEIVPDSYNTPHTIQPEHYGNPLICTLNSPSPRSPLEGGEQVYRWKYHGAKQDIVIEGHYCEGFGIVDATEYNNKQIEKQKIQQEETRTEFIEAYGYLKTSMSPDEFMAYLRGRLGWREEQVEAHEKVSQEYQKQAEAEKGGDDVDDKNLTDCVVEQGSESFDEMEEPPAHYRNETEPDTLKASATQSAPPVWDTRHSSSPLLEKMTHTLEVELGGRPIKPASTATGTPRKTDESKLTIKTMSDKGVYDHSTRQPQGYQPSFTWAKKFVAQIDTVQHFVYDYVAGSVSKSTVIEPSSQATTTTPIVEKNVYPDERTPSTQKPTFQLTEGSPGSQGQRDSIWDRWLAFDFTVSSQLTHFSEPKLHATEIVKSGPTPASVPIKSYESQTDEVEHRDEDGNKYSNDKEAIEVDSTKPSKVASAYPEPALSSIRTKTTDLNEDANFEPELRKRNFLDRIDDIEANSLESTKITSADQGTSTPGSRTDVHLEQQVGSKTGDRRRYWFGDNYWEDDPNGDQGDDWEGEDYMEWYNRVRERRSKFFLKIRQRLREAYTLQRPGGRTLKQARLENQYYRKIRAELEAKRDRIKATRSKPPPADERKPDYSHCRLDDMTEPPGPDNPICDPHYIPQYPSVPGIGSPFDTPTQPQISASNTLLPFNSPFAVFIFFLVVFLLLFRSNDLVHGIRAERAEVRVENSPTVLRADLNRNDDWSRDLGLDDDDEYTYLPDSDYEDEYGSDEDVESQSETSSAVLSNCPSWGIEEHFRRMRMVARGFENGGGGDEGYWLTA
ncbi:hypothetical protein VTL71DRAFT_12525 [Oculimacula yallundae]|uniref:Uncharacterized protein n=1 Tax=Oculimacula yallundae TaxID=86028 RepID=A0ABR4CNA7_9HELO